MDENKHRHTIWMTDEAWEQVGAHYKEDNCSAKNEYIDKAVRFYTSYLGTENAGEFLPRVLADTLEGKLGALGDRVGRLLFKMAVEESMAMNVVAAAAEYDRDDLDKLRARCVKDVRSTNGFIKFDDAYDHQHQVE